jgi:hypothetical protein
MDHYLVFSLPDEPSTNNVSISSTAEDNFALECKKRLDALDRFYDNRRLLRQERVRTARANSQTVFEGSPRMHAFGPAVSYFDIWEPDAVCITEERSGGDRRFDGHGDGPKFVCGVDYLRELYDAKQQHNKQPCLVYSIGSFNDIAFEKAIKEDIGCEIHTFDPTLTEAFVGGAYATFHPWGLGKDGAEVAIGSDLSFTAYSLDHIMHELGHGERRVNILKVCLALSF